MDRIYKNGGRPSKNSVHFGQITIVLIYIYIYIFESLLGNVLS